MKVESLYAIATLLILAFPPGMEKNPRKKISLLIARGTPLIVVLGALPLPRMLSYCLPPLHGKTLLGLVILVPLVLLFASGHHHVFLKFVWMGLLVKQKHANCDVLLDKDVFSVAIYQGFDLALILSWIVVFDIINSEDLYIIFCYRGCRGIAEV
ncbi:hypothetical protein SUGI_0913770 [Cryptomeria japonica]|nr:hypothetical protein SUGI_0913770 [Cryptomeria japonica]